MTTSIAPAPGLTTTTQSTSGEVTKFALFTDSWLDLQGYVGAALELPLTTGDFEAKYGSLESSNTIKIVLRL